MAKRTKVKRNRRKVSFTLPVAVVAGFAPGLSRCAYHFANPGEHGASNGIEAVGVEAGRIFLGYDSRNGEFNAGWATLGTLPILAGVLVHKFIGGKLGVNRMLASAGIPVIRL